jgi:hypothetical protein
MYNISQVEQAIIVIVALVGLTLFAHIWNHPKKGK